MPSDTLGIDPDELRSRIEREMPALIEIRRDLHAHPELGYEELRTSGVIQRELQTAGVEAVSGMAGGTGVLGHLPGEGELAVGLRADMDALPIQENNDIPYCSSVSGKMHACGHDGHMTVLLGAMRVLAGLAKERTLPRPVTFVFQPAEEGGAGGRRMVEDGCLDGSRLGKPVQNMFGLHGWPLMPVGLVGSRPGPLLAAADMFKVTIEGTDAHAALPHLGVDPIVAGSAVVSAAQTICSRNTDPVDAVVVSVTQFHGGTSHNIIPGRVELQGTVRTLNEATQARTVQRLKEIVEGVSASYGCTGRLDYEYGYPATLNDPVAVDVFRETVGATLGEQRVHEVPAPFMGGEDFSFYGQVVPSCFFFLGLKAEGEGRVPNLHQNNFNFNEDALAVGIEAFVQLALRP